MSPPLQASARSLRGKNVVGTDREGTWHPGTLQEEKESPWLAQIFQGHCQWTEGTLLGMIVKVTPAALGGAEAGALGAGM